MQRSLLLFTFLWVGFSTAYAQTQKNGWNPYDARRVDGKVIEDANPAGPLPTGCPLPPIKDHYIVAVSQSSRDRDPWRELMNKEIATAAQAYPQLAVIFADARQNYSKQMADVQNFLNLGIDLLIISPVEALPLTDVINHAYQHCIPVIILDRAINGDQFSVFIGANNIAIGQAAGEFAVRWCAAHQRVPCNIIELRGLEGSPPAKDRGNGFRLGIKDAVALHIVASQNADWLRELALERAALMLQENPSVDVIYAHNDSMAEAAIVAAQNTKEDMDKFLFIGIDGLPTAEGGIVSVLQKRIGVTYIYPTGGKQAVDWAVQILISHINPPHKVELSFQEVSSDNAKLICAAFQCPWSMP
ncbi:MAG: substrate-binding domain-containing protein [Chloroflexota bacterium]